VPKVQTIPGMLAATRTSLALIFLLYASLSDHKTREVSNIVWTMFAPSAFALTFIELFLYPYKTSDMPLYGLSFGLTAAFAVILFYSGGFGGADAKALMCLALALPFYPENLFTPISGIISPISQTFFPITVFSNSVLLAAATVVYIFLHNIFWRKRTGKKLFEGHENESFGKKVLILMTSYKVSVDKLNEKWHLYPVEDIEQNIGDGFKRKLVVIPRDENRNAIVERLSKAVEEGNIEDAVWATPGLPMLIFITAGLITALFFGDILWICVKFLLG
jgi:preflagellin peptidase FlaK